MTAFQDEIADALGRDLPSGVTVVETDRAALGSWFNVSDLAAASFGAAAAELAALLGEPSVTVSRRRVLRWFGMTLRPIGWTLPAAWDPIAGDYRASDGWIKLHTNAPHHRARALEVLGCDGTKEAVAQAVGQWGKTALETAILEAGGCAAAMHSLAEWQDHPQGRAVARTPLIEWRDNDAAGRPLALEGLRVLDLTRVLAGPVATRFLAGFGARVLRIDPPDWSEPGVEPEVTLGKRCAGLDLRSRAGRRAFEELLGAADVLVHGYRPGALAGLGYSAEEMRGIAPALIDVSLCAYGWEGPWAERRGFDSLVQMSSGIAAEGMARSGSERPVPLPVQALDHATGYLMAAAVLRAIRRRCATGQSVSARLSLARTAALLISGGVAETEAAMPDDAGADLGPKIENTGWGEARRVAFPMALPDGRPRWRYPSGPLRRHEAGW
ncbi:MAG: CoA transferase [Pseudomonadota bacterium]